MAAPGYIMSCYMGHLSPRPLDLKEAPDAGEFSLIPLINAAILVEPVLYR